LNQSGQNDDELMSSMQSDRTLTQPDDQMTKLGVADIAPWGVDWVWGLPLILLTVVMHVFGLALINDGVIYVLTRTAKRRSFIYLFAFVMAIAVLLATALHGVEAIAWALAYWFLGAVPDTKSAMLYSLNAMTTYGHESVSLAAPWQMMGALDGAERDAAVRADHRISLCNDSGGLAEPPPAVTRRPKPNGLAAPARRASARRKPGEVLRTTDRTR
jgi:hypothetical protein